MEKFSLQAVNTISNNFVDDCLASAAPEDDARALYNELRSICSKGGFLLNKWISNSRHVLAAIPEEERTVNATQMMPEDVDPVTCLIHHFSSHHSPGFI